MHPGTDSAKERKLTLIATAFSPTRKQVTAACLLLICSYFMPVFLSLVRRTLSTIMGDSYVPGTHSMAFVTVPDMDVARKLSHEIVKQKLAACVNIIPGLTSVYEWEDKINEDSELLLMIKTHTSKVDELSEFVRKNHPYDVAEVISAKIDNGNPPYLQWISDVVLSSQAKKSKTDS
ncbi:protein CutA homolog isoform X2 [Gigantopelta aegis]|uniref:protein CutA homolog isoform X2 n=1 Tax=Gigantopelta aegis TaxID=1735272 RepID=UPI001B88CC77|nr:protein CutA homolog isoform X2 [Gigantopelta aegis]